MMYVLEYFIYYFKFYGINIVIKIEMDFELKIVANVNVEKIFIAKEKIIKFEIVKLVSIIVKKIEVFKILSIFKFIF